MEMSRLRDARRGKYDHAQPNNPGAPLGHTRTIASDTHQASRQPASHASHLIASSDAPTNGSDKANHSNTNHDPSKTHVMQKVPKEQDRSEKPETVLNKPPSRQFFDHKSFASPPIPQPRRKSDLPLSWGYWISQGAQYPPDAHNGYVKLRSGRENRWHQSFLFRTTRRC